MAKNLMAIQPATGSHLEFSKAVASITNYAFFTLDSTGIVTNWNRGAQHVMGWNAEEACGRYFDFLYGDADILQQKPDKDLEKAIKYGAYQAEDYLIKKDGTAFLADITLAMIDRPSGKRAPTYLGVIKDITMQHNHEVDQKDANTALRQEITRRKNIEKALKDSNAELDAFASAASHDLQEPLRMVVSYLQLIDRRYREKFDADGKEFLEFAIDGATRMRTLISDLVDYARIDKLAKPFKIVPTNELVDRVINNLSLSAHDKKVTITRDNLPDIFGDEIQLNRLFQNLIANAIKFSDKQPAVIHVGAKTNTKEHTFFVEDNGKGIAANNYSTIFLIFKQLGSRAGREGSGVGLAICKKIVKRHDGRIWVESTEGEGSTFCFTIPVHKLKKGTTRG